MESEIGELYENRSDRQIAVELDMPEKEVKAKREDSGFLRLSEFADKDASSKKVDIDVKLKKMEKRKLQGFMGEKLTSLMKNRVINHLKKHLGEKWTLRNKLNVVNKNSSFQRYWASGRPRQGSIRIEGRNLKHHGSKKEELEKYVREKCVVAEEDIFRKFQEVRNPFIDFNFYAVRKSENKIVEFTLKDYSENSFESKERLKVKVPVIEDFKIVMLEVKTTKNDAKNLFSKNQRKARELANKSPHLDFFSLKVDKEFSDLGIPEDFSLNIEKHS